MATVSTVPSVIDGLLARLTAAGLKPFEQWPGPDAAREMVVLGEVTWLDYAIASIKSGRKHRQEDYTIDFELFVFGTSGSTPAAPKTARDRAFTLLALIESALADDVTAGTNHTVVQWVEARLRSAQPRVFEKGWAFRVEGQFVAHARLT